MTSWLGLLEDLPALDTAASLPDGTELVLEGVVPPWLTVLMEGEVEVWCAGRLMGFVEAPAPLALGSALAGRASRVGIRAVGAVRVRRYAREVLPCDPWFAALAEQHEALEDERLELVRGHDDFWESPNAQLLPGPYAFGPFRAFMALVEGPSGHVRGLLPPGLHPVPGFGDRYLLILADLREVRSCSPRSDGRRWTYREVTPLLPCISRNSAPGAFVPELYPDATMPTLLGREIYGFPKRVARIRLTDRVTDVVTEHRRILRARWGDRTPTTRRALVEALTRGLAPRTPSLVSSLAGAAAAHGPAPTVTVYVRDEKLHRTRLEPRTLRTDALVAIPFHFMPIEDVVRIDTFDVRFAPDHPVLAGRVLGAWSVQTGFTFGASSIVRDYCGASQ